MRQAIPRIRQVFAMLLPIILPMTISGLLLILAMTLMTSSGRDVPNATRVRPMI